MRRILSLFIAVLLVFSVIPQAVFADNTYGSISVTADKTELFGGDEVVLTVSMDGMEALKGFQYTVLYDENVFEAVSSKTEKLAGAMAVTANVENTGKIGIAVAFKNETACNGKIAEAVLRVKKDAPDKKAVFSVTGMMARTAGGDIKNDGLFAVESTPEISVTNTAVFNVAVNKTAAEAGDIVKYTFNMDSMENFTGVQFDLEYDKDILKLEGVDFGDIYNNAYMRDYNELSDSKIRFITGYDKAVTVNGRFAEVSFKVLNASKSKLNVAISGFKTKSKFRWVIPEVSVIGAETANKITLEADRAVVLPNGEVNISVYADIAEAEGFEFVVTNSSGFEFVECTDKAKPSAEVFDCEKVENGYKFIYGDTKKNALKTRLAVLKYRVKADAAGGDADFAVTELKSSGTVGSEGVTVSIDTAAEPAQLVLKADKTALAAGDTVKIEIGAEKLLNIKGIQFELFADGDVFDVASITNAQNNIFDTLQNNTLANGNIRFIGYRDSLYSEKGYTPICTVELKVKDKPVFGNTEIKISGLKSDAVFTGAEYTSDVLNVYDNTLAGTVTVKPSVKAAVYGEEVRVDLDYAATTAVRGMQLALTYNPDALEFVSAEKGDVIEGVGTVSDAEPGKVGVLYTYNDPEVKSGRIAELTFKVKDGAPAGLTRFNVENIMGVTSRVDVTVSSGIVIAESNAEVRIISDKTVLNDGNELTLNVEVKNLKNAYGIQYTLPIDADVFEIVSAENSLGDGFSTNEVDKDSNSVKVLLMNGGSKIEGEYNTAVIKLRVKNPVESKGVMFDFSKLAIASSESGYNIPFVRETASVKIVSNQSLADAVKDKIAAIGEVTLNSEPAIKAAEDAYAELTDEQKALVDNYGTLTDARAKYKKLTDDKAAADAVKDKIAAIGEVTLNSEPAIKAAEDAYAELTDDQKALVDNYGVLTDARAKYKKLTDDKAAADAVKDKIAAIGEVTLNSEPAIKAAEDAYAELTDEQKALVDNYGTLTDARAKYKKLADDKAAADAVKDKIAAIGEVTLNSEPAIKAAEDAYAELTDDQKALVDNYGVLTDARAKYDSLAAVTFVYNSGAEDKKIIVTKGEKLVQPEEPSRDGYTFTGWYKNKELTEAWSFANDAVTESMTLYAGWSEIVHGGGSGSGGGKGGSKGGSRVKNSGSSGVTVTVPTTNDANQGTGANTTKFKDIENHWAKDAIEYLAGKSVIRGMDEETFTPDNPVTRAEFTQLIYNIIKPAKVNVCDFSDVNSADWYCEAVSSVAAVGLVKGYEDNTFRPDNTISRQEMACIISRMYGYRKLPEVALKGLDSFEDKELIGSWAANDVDMIVSAGIMQGMSETEFSPLTNATRAQAAVVIKAIYMLLNK